MTLNAYQILFVQIVGKNRMSFHGCFIQRAEGSERSEANTWRGESALACCSDEVLFSYSSVSGITHRQGDGESRGEERKHVLISSAGRNV